MSTAGSVADIDIDIELAELPARGRELGRGAEARVFELPGMQLVDARGPFVYKEYRQRRPRHGNLAKVVASRARLRSDPAKLAELDSCTAWPLRQVVDRNEAVGALLPMIPDDFFVTIRMPSGMRERRPAEVQFVFTAPDRAAHYEYPLPSPEQRLTICRDLARALAFLHDEMGLVFGDISAKNELIRLDGEPAVMLVDCDAVRATGSVAQQMESPDWDMEPPQPSSMDTDRYKLGLFILRCLTPGEQCSTGRDPARVDPTVLDDTGRALLYDAIRGARVIRPTASRWYTYLARVLCPVTDPPRLVSVLPMRTMVAAGELLTVEWVATDAYEIEFSAIGCPTVTVDASPGSGTVEMRLSRTGRIAVRATNPHGVARTTTGPIAVVDVPRVRWLPVPMPDLELPRLDRTELPGLAAVLPSLPSSAAALHPMPALATPAPATPAPYLDLGHPPDVLSILTGVPSWGDGAHVRGEVIR